MDCGAMSENEYPGQEKYPTLFSPLKIGNITVRNRIMQSAHAKGWHKKEGLTNNRWINQTWLKSGKAGR